MQENNKNNYKFGLMLIGILFFIFGFITWSNSQLIPYLEIACELSKAESYYVASAFFAAYFFMSIPSSFVLKKVGFKNGMSLGLIVMALGALLFIPAANSRNYTTFLTGLFIIGSGLSLLQTASNPYAAALGPKESAAKRISIMGICNKIAGILSVYVLGSITLKNADQIKESLKIIDPTAKNLMLNELAQRVIMPYAIIAGALILLAIILFFVKMPDISDEELASETQVSDRSSVWKYPYLFIGVFALFCYVGVEVISYDTFTGLGEALGYNLDTAKHFASYTGYGLLIGYVINIIAIPKYISQKNALIYSVLLSIILVILTMFTSGKVAVICFALLGLSNSVMWPAIFPMAIDGLGKYTKIGSAFLIMAIVGGAIFPPVYAKIAAAIHSTQMGYFMMIPCYLFILYFAISGHKVGKESVR